MSDSVETTSPKPKAKAFMDAIQQFNTLEITWMFGMLEEQAKQEIERAEEESMRHKHFGRDKKAIEALDRVDFKKKCIELAGLWRDAHLEFEMPSIIAGLRAASGVHPKPPKKKVNSTYHAGD